MDNILVSDIHFNPENELWHHGILGMKWGIRRFQPYSLIPRKSGKRGKEQGAAKKGKGKSLNTGTAGNTKVKKVVGKKSRNQKSVEAKATYEQKAKTARQRQQELEKIVNSGDAKLVYEHKSELSKKQLDAAIDRINTEAKVKALVSAQNPSKIKKLKNFAQNVDDINSIARSGLNAYKTADEIIKTAKGVKEAKTKAQKAEASAKLLRDLIDTGADAKSAIELQSKLSDSDLKKLKERVKTLDELGKVERGDAKRASDAEEKQADYLRKSLADLEKARQKTRFDDVDSSSGLDAYDRFINNEVSKRNKTSTRVKDIDDGISRKNDTSARVKDIDVVDDRSSAPSSSPNQGKTNSPSAQSAPKKEIKSYRDNPNFDKAVYDAGVRSGKMADPKEVQRLLKQIEADERRDKRRSQRNAHSKLAGSSMTVKKQKQEREKPTYDKAIYEANVRSGKMADPKEVQRLLEQIEADKIPVKKLTSKKKKK